MESGIANQLFQLTLNMGAEDLPIIAEYHEWVEIDPDFRSEIRLLFSGLDSMRLLSYRKGAIRRSNQALFTEHPFATQNIP